MAAGLGRDELAASVDHFLQVLGSRGRLAPDEGLLGDAVAFAGISRYPARVKYAMLSWVAAEDALHQGCCGA